MRTRILITAYFVLLAAASGFAQDRMSRAKRSGIPIGKPQQNQALPQKGPGPITFFTSRAVFDATFPGLPCEDWEDFTNAIVGCDAPANNTTSCPGGYAVGEILPGLEIDCAANSGPGLGGLVVISAGFDGNPSIVFGSNFFVDNTIVRTNPAIEAIGLDIQCHFGSPLVNVDVFNGVGLLVASTTSACANAGTFLGASSNDIAGIGSIVINDPTGASVESVELVCFGGVPVPVDLLGIDVE